VNFRIEFLPENEQMKNTHLSIKNGESWAEEEIDKGMDSGVDGMEGGEDMVRGAGLFLLCFIILMIGLKWQCFLGVPGRFHHLCLGEEVEVEVLVGVEEGD
jgi:hypothetical protein